jgi:hypothetical protein
VRGPGRDRRVDERAVRLDPARLLSAGDHEDRIGRRPLNLLSVVFTKIEI